MIKEYMGAIPNPKDSRDFVLGDIPYTPDPNAPSWEEGFDNETEYGQLKREHQGSSLSCVGQGWSKYAEMLNIMETRTNIDLSARFIYSQIFLNQGGAYIRDGARIITKQGDAPQIDVPDYMNGANPTESFMRGSEGVEDARIIANTYKSLKYVWLDADKVNEDMRQIIWQYGGFVSGYNGHCMYASAYGMVNGKKAIKFINSYGVGSDQWVTEEDSHRLYDITFLVDLHNNWNNTNTMTAEQLRKLYLLVFKREPDVDAEPYIGKDWNFVLDELLKSLEHEVYSKLYAAGKEIENL